METLGTVRNQEESEETKRNLMKEPNETKTLYNFLMYPALIGKDGEAGGEMAGAGDIGSITGSDLSQ